MEEFTRSANIGRCPEELHTETERSEFRRAGRHYIVVGCVWMPEGRILSNTNCSNTAIQTKQNNNQSSILPLYSFLETFDYVKQGEFRN